MIVSEIAGDMLSDLHTLTGRGLSGDMLDARLANLLHLTRCLQWRVDFPWEPMPERGAAGRGTPNDAFDSIVASSSAGPNTTLLPGRLDSVETRHSSRASPASNASPALSSSPLRPHLVGAVGAAYLGGAWHPSHHGGLACTPPFGTTPPATPLGGSVGAHWGSQCRDAPLPYPPLQLQLQLLAGLGGDAVATPQAAVEASGAKAIGLALALVECVEAVHTSQRSRASQERTTQRTPLHPLPVRSSFEALDKAVTRRETAIGIGGLRSALSPSSAAVSPPSAASLRPSHCEALRLTLKGAVTANDGSASTYAASLSIDEEDAVDEDTCIRTLTGLGAADPSGGSAVADEALAALLPPPLWQGPPSRPAGSGQRAAHAVDALLLLSASHPVGLLSAPLTRRPHPPPTAAAAKESSLTSRDASAVSCATGAAQAAGSPTQALAWVWGDDALGSAIAEPPPPVFPSDEPRPGDTSQQATLGRSVRFSACHEALCRTLRGAETWQPRLQEYRLLAEEVMSRVGMLAGVGAMFDLSTDADAVSLPLHREWFTRNERRLVAGCWRLRAPCNNAVAIVRLVASVIQRWVRMPARENRDVGSLSSSRQVDMKQRGDTPGTLVVTFGDSAWLRDLQSLLP